MKSGWQVKKLGEIIKLEYGKPLADEDRNPNGKYPAYGANGIKDRTNRFYYNKPTIIIGRKGSAGEINLTEEKFWPLDVTYYVTFDESKVNLRFLYNALTMLNLTSLARGVKPGINRNDVYAIEIPIPPLSEQQRIVAVLDDAFAGIAAATENAKKNLQNARALFESHLQSTFTTQGDGWVEKKLGDVCLKITDGAHHSPKNLYPTKGENQFPYITSKNIRNGYMDLTNVSYVDQDFHDSIYSSCKPELGDVLLTKDGANTGNVTLNTLDEPYSLLSSVCLIKPDKEKLLSKYLMFYIQSSVGLKKIIGQMTGAAIKRIILKAVKLAAIPIPSVEEQQRIVAQLDALSAETKRLEAIYTQKLALLAALKQSLLQKAFAGELLTDKVAA